MPSDLYYKPFIAVRICLLKFFYGISDEAKGPSGQGDAIEILSSGRVRLLVAPSERRNARGESLQRKAKAYVNTTLTIQDYLRRGLREDDIAWDYQRDFISIVDETGAEIAKNPRRPSVAIYLASKNDRDQTSRREANST
jgi:hypothetical protein